MANFNLNSSKSMKDFEKVLTKKATELAKKRAKEREYTIDCYHCDTKVTVPVGKSICPNCSEEIDLNLDLKF
ncbi:MULTISPECIES: hypothetical protein [unclassified Lactococcus]|uniref:hypothetical protein n=1 Tax=unclassified Lactococcus TaxID=2643510 RepID=UPI0011CC5387|nr:MULTISPECIES: hypothetical protein [unclassified Lactococcus]MQW24106.1 hypothetical protein [Lactococcus sp. dk101]TXK33899.1 hypothetical protein FVP42_11420 [Lactococcus sp. dk310]TXK45324.1 hypothetical protein FVP43_11490 [Lactococcus sp. dk322]